MSRHIKSDPLKKLKERLVELQRGNLNVEAENPNIVRCWERLNCRQRQCPAYGKLRCWSIAGTMCHDEVRGETARKLGDCQKCVVYRESCGDEYSELLEIFNQTVKDLKFSFSRDAREKARLERFAGLEEMAATVAHETRNPLHAIGLATAYLKKNYHDKVITDFLVIIDEELQRLNEVIDSFLAFAKPAPFQGGWFEPGLLAAEVVASLQTDAEARGVEIVSEQQGESTFYCDGTKMKDLYYQLLVNSLEASSAGGSIQLRQQTGEDGLAIEVSDEGAGIDDKDIEQVMDPFFTTKTRGPGLGLALVDRIVREHQGNIEISSRGDGGTVVSVRLPKLAPQSLTVDG